MVTPVVKKEIREFYPYFPQDYWFDLQDLRMVHSGREKGRAHLVRSPLYEAAPCFVRGGHILHMQRAD